MKKDTQKPSKGRTILVVVLLVIIIACIILIFMPSNGDSENQADTTAQTTQESTQADSSDENAEEIAESSSESEIETEDSETRKSGSYDLDEMSIIYSDSVRDDKTGNWRLAKVTGAKSAEEYALDYYNEFFTEDSELHAIVNYDLNTTACLTVISGNINVRIYEHVDG